MDGDGEAVGIDLKHRMGWCHCKVGPFLPWVREININHGGLWVVSWDWGRMHRTHCSLGGGGRRPDRKAQQEQRRKWSQLGIQQQELRLGGLPGGHLRNSEAAVLRPHQSLVMTFSKHKLSLWPCKSVLLFQAHILAQGTKPSFNPHPHHLQCQWKPLYPSWLVVCPSCTHSRAHTVSSVLIREVHSVSV